MNKIGQDLVDLGVRKTRKAKGNIYALKNPSKKEIEQIANIYKHPTPILSNSKISNCKFC